MKSLLIVVLCLALIAEYQALDLKRALQFLNDPACQDKLPQAECDAHESAWTCWTEEARENCGTTCKSCGDLCTDATPGCAFQHVKDELCPHSEAAYMICPRSCGLCV